MNFNEYVDDLAKRGIIDGNIAETLVGKHKDECANPKKPIQIRVNPILRRMWLFDNEIPASAIHKFADEIDDAIEEA